MNENNDFWKSTLFFCVKKLKYLSLYQVITYHRFSSEQLQIQEKIEYLPFCTKKKRNLRNYLIEKLKSIDSTR